MAGMFLNEGSHYGGVMCTGLGVMFMGMVITLGPDVFKTGAPADLYDLKEGQYSVVRVYEAGGNVSLILSLPNYGDKNNKSEYARFYQSNKTAFDGDIKLNATKLDVIVTGSFKKLKLE